VKKIIDDINALDGWTARTDAGGRLYIEGHGHTLSVSLHAASDVTAAVLTDRASGKVWLGALDPRRIAIEEAITAYGCSQDRPCCEELGDLSFGLAEHWNDGCCLPAASVTTSPILRRAVGAPPPEEMTQTRAPDPVIDDDAGPYASALDAGQGSPTQLVLTATARVDALLEAAQVLVSRRFGPSRISDPETVLRIMEAIERSIDE
jgi:hypothetical protein